MPAQRFLIGKSTFAFYRRDTTVGASIGEHLVIETTGAHFIRTRTRRSVGAAQTPPTPCYRKPHKIGKLSVHGQGELKPRI
jgi:hypothetical protein